MLFRKLKYTFTFTNQLIHTTTMKIHKLIIVAICLSVLTCISASAQTWQEYDSLRWQYQQKESYDSAVIYARLTVKLVEKETGNESELYADKLVMLSYMLSLNNQTDSAIIYLEKELIIRKKYFDSNPGKYEESIYNLAGLYYDAQEYEKSLQYYRESMELYGKLNGFYNEAYIFRQNSVAQLYQILNRFTEAYEVFTSCLKLIESHYGKEHEYYGILANNTARLLYNMGDYETSLPLYLEALDNFGKNEGTDSYNYGIALDNIGNVYQMLGQYDKALEYFSKANTNFIASVGKEHFSYAISLSNLANLYKTTGEYEKALPLYIEAIDVTVKVLGKDHYYYGTFINNLGGLYQDMNQFDKALPLYLEALDNAEKTLGKDHSYYAIRLNNLANLYQMMGRFDEALRFFNEVLATMERTVGKDHLYYSTNLMNLARLYCQMKRPGDALPVYRQAYENNYTNIRKNFCFLSENEKENFVKTISDNFNSYLSFYYDFAAENPVVGGDVYNIELSTKGMILQSGIQMRQSIINSGDAQLLQKYDEWQATRELLAQQYSLPESKRNSNLAESERKAEMLESDLTRISGAFQQTQLLGNTTWSDIQKALKPNEVAIEFASFPYLKEDVETGKTQYIALVLNGSDPYPHLVPLFEQTQLDSLLSTGSESKLVNNLYRSITIFHPGEVSSFDYGKRLYQLLWKPIEKYIPENATVYFSPSGTLHQIAFAAVTDENKIKISDQYRLVQLSTTAMLVHENESTTLQSPSICLFGGIDYEAGAGDMLAIASGLNQNNTFVSRSLADSGERGGGVWNYLPGTLQEVNSIALIAKKHNAKTQVFSGKSAVEEQVKALSGVTSPPIIHIATHGFFFSDVEKVSEGSSGTRSGEMVYRSATNPLNRSGLLFAGANAIWSGNDVPEGIDDGILTAYEASNITLGSTKLVVLSACETGLGDIKGSEGVFGLQRSFKAAGADYLMMSLWKVPDAETAMFMEYFYESLYNGSSIRDAFLETQNRMKKLFPDEPGKWAAFVLVR